MAGAIGPASDFYRLRLTRLDVGGEVEFDWRDDVLWREEPAEFAEETDVWVLEAVTLDADEVVTRVAAIASHDEARSALEEATADLEAMTRSEFEAEYLREPPGTLDEESEH